MEDMLQIDNFIYASDLTEAYDILLSVPNSVVLGGCGYLRLGKRSIGTAIDLSKLDLAFISESDGAIEIGAMTTLRAIETHPLTSRLWNGVMKSALSHIVGVQLRACVTIGGTVAGRYPFSDPLTALLALDARLLFHRHGEVSLEDYLAGKAVRDILVKILLPTDGRLAAFTSIRRANTDYAVLNAAVAQTVSGYRLIVGSRPGRAMHAATAADYLVDNGLNDATAVTAGKLAAETLQFGDNPRGSAAYRKAVCPVLIQRALTEVNHAA